VARNARPCQSERGFAEPSQPPFLLREHSQQHLARCLMGVFWGNIIPLFASAHFSPDRLVFQDSVATSAGLQPSDPAAASPVPVIRKQLCFERVVAK
jgi:hypothetical protein